MPEKHTLPQANNRKLPQLVSVHETKSSFSGCGRSMEPPVPGPTILGPLRRLRAAGLGGGYLTRWARFRCWSSGQPRLFAKMTPAGLGPWGVLVALFDPSSPLGDMGCAGCLLVCLSFCLLPCDILSGRFVYIFSVVSVDGCGSLFSVCFWLSRRVGGCSCQLSFGFACGSGELQSQTSI